MMKNGARPKLTAECLGLGKGSMYFATNHPLFALFSGNPNADINNGNNTSNVTVPPMNATVPRTTHLFNNTRIFFNNNANNITDTGNGIIVPPGNNITENRNHAMSMGIIMPNALFLMTYLLI
jgi:hypothetical protein